MAAADSAAWATLCPEILLAILRTPAVVAAASRVCRHWRTCATLVTAAEGAHFASDAEMRRFCAACPELRLLRVDPEARVSDVGGAGVALLSELRTFALTGWTSTGERTLGALAALAALSSLDLSWCALLSDQAIRNFAAASLPALRSLSLRGCRRIGDAPVAELLRSASALTHLDLSFCVQVGNEAVRALSGMHDLRTLSMRSLSRVTGDGAAAIGALHSLTELDVSYCSEIASQSLDSWTSLCSLRVVALSGCGNITSFGVGRLLMAWTTLETLDLFNVPNLSDLALSYALPALTRLRCLDISHNPHLSARSVSLLSHLTNLTDLSASGLHGVEPAAFGAILALTALRALGLHSNHGLPSYILSAMSRRLTGLTQLGLRHCCSHRDNEHDASCSGDVFSGLRRSMRHLDLSYSRLGSAPQLSHLESLESLHLCGCCEVTDDVLSRIARLPNLYTLDLGRCDGVTDEGLALLAPASRLSALQLHGCTKVTDRGIRALSRLPSLASLDVCECCVGDEGLCALAQPALRSLNALNCAGSVSDAAVTHVATALTALTSLHMDLAAVRSVDSVARLSNLRALTQLDVAKFRSELLPGLAQATSLRSLIVANASGSAEFASLATLELESLQILRCPDVKPSDLVAGLAQCGRLCHVVLLDCPHITAAGLAPLAPRTTALQEISVSVFHENPATVLDTLRAHFPAASLTAYVDGNEVGHA